MFGSIYFGEYYTAGLAAYVQHNYDLVSFLGGVTPALAVGKTSVSQSLTGQSNASFSVRDVRPVPFTPFRLGIGSLEPSRLIFNGEILDSLQTFDESNLIRWDASAVDSSMQFNRHLVFASFTNVAADVAAKALLAAFAPDFSGAIQTGLATITLAWQGETLDNCFATLAQAIGGYYYRDLSYAVHLFITETPAMTPDALDGNNKTLLLVPPIKWDANVSQTRNRGIGIGAGVALAAAVAPGETIIPVVSSSLFNSSGTVLIGSQRVTYGGKTAGGGGSLVGPGVSPSSAPSLAAAAGSGLGIGWYGYAVVDVTAAGKTLPGPGGTVATLAAVVINPPSDTPAAQQSIYGQTGGHQLTNGATYTYGYTFNTIYGETSMSAPSAGIVAGPTFGINFLPQYTGLNQGTSLHGITSVNYYRSVNGGTYRRWTTQSGSYGSPVYDLYLSDADIAGNPAPPGSNGGANIPAFQQVTVTGIALGASPTTSREVYRTAVQATQAAALTAQLKLLTTLANNTSTGPYTDSTADGSLGANVPVGDTSGIAQAAGQVNAGSTSLLLAGAGPFSSSGGWALSGIASIRYTGITGNTLTGIPASGNGSILTTLPYGSQVLPAPSLTGVPASGPGSVTQTTIDPNTAVVANAWLYSQRDNLTSQALVAAIEGVNPQGVASDGIYEMKISDNLQTTQAGLDALVDADLFLYASSLGVITVTYETLDSKSFPGRPVAVNMAWLVGTFIIQTVTIVLGEPGIPPVYQVTASSVRYTLQDVLKHLSMG
jgi:hypothetical protein